MKAALAELPEIPDRRVPRWALGIGVVAVGDLAEQAFLPWRRDRDARPPARFAACLGLVFLAVPVYFVAAPLVGTQLEYGPVAQLASLTGVALCLWLNIAAVLKADALGGLIYAVGLRLLPLNLAALLLAGVVVFLVSNAPF